MYTVSQKQNRSVLFFDSQSTEPLTTSVVLMPAFSMNIFFARNLAGEMM